MHAANVAMQAHICQCACALPLFRQSTHCNVGTHTVASVASPMLVVWHNIHDAAAAAAVAELLYLLLLAPLPQSSQRRSWRRSARSGKPKQQRPPRRGPGLLQGPAAKRRRRRRQQQTRRTPALRRAATATTLLTAAMCLQQPAPGARACGCCACDRLAEGLHIVQVPWFCRVVRAAWQWQCCQ
jgi:hypothetical protein